MLKKASKLNGFSKSKIQQMDFIFPLPTSAYGINSGVWESPREREKKSMHEK